MGCSIHMHIEIKIDGVWEHYAHPNIARDYALFAKMADVRNNGDISPIALPKGIPVGMTKITSLDYSDWDTDAHGVSWFHVHEILELEEWLETRKVPDGNILRYHLEHSILHTYLFGNGFTSLVKYPEDIRIKGLEDVRFVFWFDN